MPAQKRTRSVIPAGSTDASPSIPTKKLRAGAPATLSKGKVATLFYRAIAGSSRPVPPNTRPSQVVYPPLDQFWLTFGDRISTQYLKNAATLEDYCRLVKYFHGRLVLLVRGLYLPEVATIFHATLPVWHNSADSVVQDKMEEAFESAYDWVNHEITKKIRTYSYAWFQTPAGKAYEQAWAIAKKNKSSRYPYPEDPKLPEDMLSSGPNAGLIFERTHVIDFWLVGFASVETEDTPSEKFVGWLKNDADGSWYRHLRSAALMLILKYSMLSMEMPDGDIYKLTVSTMMRSVLTFNLSNGIEETSKLGLVCRSGGKSLSLYDLEPYELKDNKSDDVVIPETEAESPLTISSPRLTPGVRAADGFRVALTDPPESQFTASEGLSDVDHVRRHARAVIDLEKEYGFSLGPHRLDSLSPPVLAPAAVDEVARRYSRLPLERADDFHQKRMEQEIARLDIIVSQAANRASALQAALARVRKRKAKYLEQLEHIQTMKANNLKMVDKIKVEQLELERLKSSSD